MSRFRTLFFMSAGASALALALASPAVAQSGAPASGTSEDPPATGVSTGAATPTRADDGARPVHARGLEDIVVTAGRKRVWSGQRWDVRVDVMGGRFVD